MGIWTRLWRVKNSIAGWFKKRVLLPKISCYFCVVVHGDTYNCSICTVTDIVETPLPICSGDYSSWWYKVNCNALRHNSNALHLAGIAIKWSFSGVKLVGIEHAFWIQTRRIVIDHSVIIEGSQATKGKKYLTKKSLHQPVKLPPKE